jgi:hypothetical protein
MKRLGSMSVFVVLAAMVACSSSSGTTPGGSSGGDGGSSADGGSSGDGGGGGTSSGCGLPHGSYTMRFTNEKPSAECPDLPDRKHEVDAEDDLPFVAEEDEPGCTSSYDEAACTASSSCEWEEDGEITKVSLNGAIRDGVYRGTMTETVIGEGGVPVSDCEYSFEMTKD